MKRISQNPFYSDLTVVFIISVLLSSCCNKECQKNISEKSEKNETAPPPRPAYNIKAERPYIWLNLMPGGEPKYYCTAEIFISCPEIEPEVNADIHSVTFIQETITVPLTINSEIVQGYKDEESIYCVKLTLSTKEGFYRKDINPDKNAGLHIEVSVNGNNIPYRIVDVPIERVY